MRTIEDIVADFEVIEDWEERYRYIIELGRDLAPLADADHNDINKVRGCASQVWLQTSVNTDGPEPVLTFLGDSDAHIVRGLVAVTIALFSGKTASEILKVDPEATFNQIGLREHLTPQRSNGVNSMIQRIKSDAGRSLTGA